MFYLKTKIAVSKERLTHWFLRASNERMTDFSHVQTGCFKLEQLAIGGWLTHGIVLTGIHALYVSWRTQMKSLFLRLIINEKIVGQAIKV